MARMTPLEFAQRYLALDTYIFKQTLPANTPTPSYVPPIGWNQLRVDNYRLGASQWDDKFWNENISANFRDPVTVCVKTIWGDVVEHTFTKASSARRHFHAPFVGKGTPEQAQIAIQLVYRFRPVTTSLAEFVARNFIGLDCNGFVGNYIQRVVQEQDWLTADNDRDPGPTTFIDDLVRNQGTVLKSIEDIGADGTYVLGWCRPDGSIRDPSREHPTDYGHIMISEPNTLKRDASGLSFGVTEATAAGEGKLRHLTYTIRDQVVRAQHGSVFRVQRGPGGSEMDVRISRLRV